VIASKKKKIIAQLTNTSPAPVIEDGGVLTFIDLHLYLEKRRDPKYYSIDDHASKFEMKGR